MTDPDLTRLPTGEMGWAALVAHAAATDDRIERYFLEVKSDIDLTSRSGRAKVAKFILGASNRDPAQAGRRFGGHAVMLLGIGGGATPGIAPFEAQDLARDVARWIGVEGPSWDFERIQTGEPQDVIAVIVDPPTRQIWTCRADGDGLADGDIYVRGDGNTRKATGDEVRAMLARATTPTAEIAVAVSVAGEVLALTVDPSVLTDWAEARRHELLKQVAPRPAVGRANAIAAFSSLNFSLDRRSPDEFRAQVDSWHQGIISDPAAGVVTAAGRLFAGVRVRVKNQTRTYLRDLQIDLEFDGEVQATQWDARPKSHRTNLFPDPPIDWGEGPRLAFPGLQHLSKLPLPRHGDRNVEIADRTPARLVLRMDSLRPEEEFLSDDDDVVLVMLVDANPDRPVSGRWRMTAGDVNDVYDGEFTIPVKYRDWRGPINALLFDGDDATEGPDAVTELER